MTGAGGRLAAAWGSIPCTGLGVLSAYNGQRTETEMTAKGDAFALQLARLGVPVSDHVRDVCARLARCAVTVDRLAVEECNGPAWVDSPAFTGAAVERWQANLDKRQAAAGVRFGRLVNDLRAAVAAADPDGVNRYVGGWSVGGDPRGYTAVVDVTRANGDTVTVGVLS